MSMQKLWPTLYSKTSSGAQRYWIIETNGAKYRTRSAVIDGKEMISAWTHTIAKNVGKKNATTGETQAIAAAQAKYDKKLEAGYVHDLADIDKTTFVKPMLAKKWEDRREKVEFPLWAQPKLDGMRAIITKDGAFSRNGKPWVTIPHILDALQHVFDQQPELILDGELYCHGLADDFNKISSLVKKTKPTDADLEESAEKIQYWWYDICALNLSFESRTLIRDSFRSETEKIVIVPTHKIVNEAHLDSVYDEFIADGYEGQMVRTDGEYEFKRSNSLLKRKDFIDEEYEIVNVVEGKGNKTGTAASMTLRRKDGVEFNSNVKGNDEYRKQLLAQKDELVGKWATCKYFNLTPAGIPRFPFVIGIRDGVGID